MALPSKHTDYDFLFSATLCWMEISAPSEMAFNRAGLARQAILERASSVGQRWEPGRLFAAEAELTTRLGVFEPDSTGRIRVMAEDITLELAEQDRAHLARLAEIRRQEEVWGHERRQEQERRSYLSDDVLKSPGSAVVWWLSKQNEQIDEAVDSMKALGLLSAAATGTELSDSFRRLLDPTAVERTRGTTEPEGASGSNGESGSGRAPYVDLPTPAETAATVTARPAGPAESLELFLASTGLRTDDPRRSMITRMIARCLREDSADVADAILTRLAPEEMSSPVAPSPPTPDDNARSDDSDQVDQEAEAVHGGRVRDADRPGTWIPGGRQADDARADDGAVMHRSPWSQDGSGPN